MAASAIRCRLTGCDPDDCGVCRRCGLEKNPRHQWKDAPGERPCFPRQVCERCGTAREQPDHDWEPSGRGLRCSRCDLSI